MLLLKSRRTSIGVLTETYVAIEKAMATIDQAAEFTMGCPTISEEAAAQVTYLDAVSNYLSECLSEVIKAIKETPLRTNADRFERLRFEMVAYANASVKPEQIRLMRTLLDSFRESPKSVRRSKRARSNRASVAPANKREKRRTSG